MAKALSKELADKEEMDALIAQESASDAQEMDAMLGTTPESMPFAGKPVSGIVEAGKKFLGTAFSDVPQKTALSAIGAMQEGKNPVSGIKEYINTGVAPGGEDILTKAGVPASAAKYLKYPAEMIVDPGMLLGGFGAGRKIGTALGKKASEEFAVPLAKNIATKYTEGVLTKLAKTAAKQEAKGISIPEIADMVVREELAPYMTNLKKLREVIGGVEVKKTTTLPSGLYKTTMEKTKKGLKDETKDAVDSILASNKTTVNVQDLGTDIAIEDMFKRLDTTLASKPITDPAVNKYMTSLIDNLKLNLEPSRGRSLTELNDLRRDLNKMMVDFSKVQTANPQELSDTMVALKDASEGIRGAILKNLEGGKIKLPNGKMEDAAVAYDLLQNKYSKLITLEDLAATAPDPRTFAQKMVDIGLGGIAGGLAGIPLGQPAWGAAAGAGLIGLGARKGAIEGSKDLAAGYLMDLPSKVQKAGYRAGAVVDASLVGAPIYRKVQEQNSANNVGREPQSIPEQLVRTTIPRSVQGIKDQANFVKMKVAQQYPMMFDQVQETLDHNPEYIQDLLPVLAKAMPSMFPRDEYNRIDGIITDPALIDRARMKTSRRTDLTNKQKTEILQKLNTTGEFDL
jgi:hypothetical protein